MVRLAAGYGVEASFIDGASNLIGVWVDCDSPQSWRGDPRTADGAKRPEKSEPSAFAYRAGSRCMDLRSTCLTDLADFGRIVPCGIRDMGHVLGSFGHRAVQSRMPRAHRWSHSPKYSEWRGLSRTSADDGSDAGIFLLTLRAGPVESTWKVWLVGLPDDGLPATTSMPIATTLPLSVRVDTGGAWTEGNRGDLVVTVRNRTQAPANAIVSVDPRSTPHSRIQAVPQERCRRSRRRVRGPFSSPSDSAWPCRRGGHLRAPGIGDDAVVYDWPVRPAGEQMNISNTAWVDRGVRLAVPLEAEHAIERSAAAGARARYRRGPEDSGLWRGRRERSSTCASPSDGGRTVAQAWEATAKRLDRFTIRYGHRFECDPGDYQSSASTPPSVTGSAGCGGGGAPYSRRHLCPQRVEQKLLVISGHLDKAYDDAHGIVAIAAARKFERPGYDLLLSGYDIRKEDSRCYRPFP